MLGCRREVRPLGSGHGFAVLDAGGAGSFVEVDHCVGGLGDEHAAASVAEVVAPGEVGGVDHVVVEAVLDPVVAEVGGDHALARPWRRSMDASFSQSLAKRWTSVSSGCRRRAEASRVNAPPASTDWSLGPVPHEQQLRPGLRCEVGHPVERERSCEGRFVNDHELTLLELSSPVVVVVEPLGGVVALDAEVFCQDGCGCRRGCEADDAVFAVGLGPGRVEGSHRGGLPCSGWSDEQVDLASRYSDGSQGCDLLMAEVVAKDVFARDVLDVFQFDHGRVPVVGTCE